MMRTIITIRRNLYNKVKRITILLFKRIRIEVEVVEIAIKLNLFGPIKN